MPCRQNQLDWSENGNLHLFLGHSIKVTYEFHKRKLHLDEQLVGAVSPFVFFGERLVKRGY
jgi:uncharacterized membrane protein